MEHSAEEVAKHVRIYVTVFVALMVLTIGTVLASYLDVPMAVAILIAIAIALVKGSLVACFFMHLISERRLIYSVLILTVVFFMALMMLPVLDVSGGVGVAGL